MKKPQGNDSLWGNVWFAAVFRYSCIPPEQPCWFREPELLISRPGLPNNPKAVGLEGDDALRDIRLYLCKDLVGQRGPLLHGRKSTMGFGVVLA